VIVFATLAYLVVADLVGVAVCFFYDAIASERRTSTALFYAIWFVAGVFCGMLSYLTCGNIAMPEKTGDFIRWKDEGQTGLLVILTTAVILVALSLLFYKLQWQYPRADSVYVPDSEPLTITFFVTILASVIFAHKTLRPEPKKKISQAH
jgi:hypothetical protein